LAQAQWVALTDSGIARRTKTESSTMLMRPIPSSGEKLPVIGLGSGERLMSI
jgi:hypothetical protein